MAIAALSLGLVWFRVGDILKSWTVVRAASVVSGRTLGFLYLYLSSLTHSLPHSLSLSGRTTSCFVVNGKHQNVLKNHIIIIIIIIL